MSAAAAVALAPILADPQIVRSLRLKFGAPVPPVGDGRTEKYQWTRAGVLGLAKPHCTTCQGRGWFAATSGYACHCVTRGIFRQLMVEWRKIKDAEHLAQFRVEQIGQRGGKTCKRGTWSMKRPEFVADLEILARRVLAPTEWRVWCAYHCHGLEWREACDLLRMDKGSFYHSVYRVETQIGRAAREVRPYALFPVADYYGL